MVEDKNRTAHNSSGNTKQGHRCQIKSEWRYRCCKSRNLECGHALATRSPEHQSLLATWVLPDLHATKPALPDWVQEAGWCPMQSAVKCRFEVTRHGFRL